MSDISQAGKIDFLLLEDVDTFRKLMIKDLDKLGIKGDVHEAGTVQEAKDLCGTAKFQFIIADWILPDGTGYDFLLEVKQNDALKDLPFVVFTTIDDVEHMLKAIEAGADEFIVKPWLFDDLKEKLSHAWGKHNK